MFQARSDGSKLRSAGHRSATPRPGHQLADLLHNALGRCIRRLPPLALLGRCWFVGPAGALVAELGLNPARAHLRHPLPADVVAPSLQDREVERRREAEPRLHLGKVLLGQLVLQRLGRRGDDDLLAAQRRRDEVGQRLAGSGPGLDDEVVRVAMASATDGTSPVARAVLAAGHLGGDLVEPAHGVVAGFAGFGLGPARGAEDIELVEPVGLEVLEGLVRHRR